MDKEKDFSEWYNDVLEKADIIDLRYPVKGMPVYKPWGFYMLRACFDKLEEKLEKTGHKKSMFPILIPEEFLEKEKEHMKGFEDQVYWVEEEGRKMALRPTSETIMYPMFAMWIRSHRDLPLKVHQTCCVYRCETKATRPLIRGREVFWNEAHTAHRNFEEAAEQVRMAVKLYSEFFTELGIPFLILNRPEYDKFPGAVYSVAFDTLMPDGRTLQIGTVHHLGDNFAKAFDVIYEDEDGNKKHVHQTSFGISMRALASIVGIHGDGKGLVIPPELAPVQIVIVPIIFEKSKEEVMKKCVDLKKKLRYRSEIDERDETAGSKYYYWELRGVPLRLEIGPRDIKEGKVVLVRRDTGEKRSVRESELEREIESTFRSIIENMRKEGDSA